MFFSQILLLSSISQSFKLTSLSSLIKFSKFFVNLILEFCVSFKELYSLLRPEDFDSTADIFLGLWQYIIGSFALAGIAALLLWIVFYFLFSVTNQKQVVKP